MTRDNLLRALAVVLLVAGGIWLASVTEWVDQEVPLPARGEAAKNPLYATQALARGLGASVVRKEGLSDMPPPQATLVITSRNWDLLPRRAQRLHDWVQSGGQLVIPKWAMHLSTLEDLVPIDYDDEADRHFDSAQCHELIESGSTGRAVESAASTYRVCTRLEGPALRATGGNVLWAVSAIHGVEVMRVAVGRGSITVVGPWDLMDNAHLLKEDHALLTAASLQLRAGATVWFVAEETRTPFLLWLWQSAWPVLLASLLAIALALWRTNVRFGAVVTPLGAQRRSMTEQVLGTAQFLHQHGGATLHAAALRALHEAARARLHTFATQTVFEQARILASVTGLNERELARALTPPKSKAKQALSWQLELLETARRRLLAQRASAPVTGPTATTESAPAPREKT